MKKLLIVCAAFTASTAFANNLNTTETKDVQTLINLFKTKNITAISNQISYPLQREAPIPSIDNKAEMKQRFTQVFDPQLIQKIANSKTSQWDSVGSRGVMLDGGTLWLNGGKITAVNYSSQAEQQYKKQLTAKQNNGLHTSLKNFKQPTLQFKTSKFRVRIDELSNGQYRYASWGAKQSPSQKPDLIINQGKIIMDGSGGNHHFVFNRGTYQYSVYHNIVGSKETPAIQLKVTQKAKTILSQTGDLIK